MIKGLNKRVIVMKDTGSALIEEAFFILRSGAEKGGIKESEILRHANSILEKNELDRRFSSLSMNVCRDQKYKKSPWQFVFGLAIGIAVTAVVFIV